MVTRLSGPGFATRQDVITGLPRAIANHATNSIHFGPDGKLYIAQGGNTGRRRAEHRQHRVRRRWRSSRCRRRSWSPTCATPASTAPATTPRTSSARRRATCRPTRPACATPTTSSSTATGRSTGPTTASASTGTFPPSPTRAVHRVRQHRPVDTSGGHNPGQQPDALNRIEQGKYYGHPNPYRNECVFKDGSYQGVGAAAELRSRRSTTSATTARPTASIEYTGRTRSAASSRATC